MAARISFMLTRSVTGNYLGEDWKNQMLRIKDCTGCRVCASRCPYELDPPAMLKKQLAWYLDYYEQSAASRGVQERA
jgi:Fe-S oxidoreductase